MHDLIRELSTFDTPTICNALDLLSPERSDISFTDRTLICAFPDAPPMVGLAATARIRSRVPAGRSAQEAAAIRGNYYTYVQQAPGPAVMVVQDLDQPTGFGGIWGDVNAAIHKGLGAIGVITDGAFRDWPLLPKGFQIVAAAVTPSHGHGHIVDWGTPVEVAGLHTRPGQLIHADRHGAVSFPAELAGKLPAAARLIQRREKVLIEAARQPKFSAEAAVAAFAAAAKLGLDEAG